MWIERVFFVNLNGFRVGKDISKLLRGESAELPELPVVVSGTGICGGLVSCGVENAFVPPFCLFEFLVGVKMIAYQVGNMEKNLPVVFSVRPFKVKHLSVSIGHHLGGQRKKMLKAF